jgi:hypothetical protein
MKQLFYILPVLFIALSACKKNEKDNLHVVCPAGPSLGGPWELNAYWNSPGAGDLTWFPATEKVTIRFDGSNLFSSTKTNQDRFYADIKTYNQVTDTIIKLYKQGGTDTAAYILKFNRDTLYLYNLGCIEGCAEKYARPTGDVVQ